MTPGDRIVLFLDFDGVLHAPNCRASRLFEHLARLEAVLGQFPEVDVVVSSSWRVRRTLEQLREPFAPETRQRVIDATPVLPFQRERPHRGLECTTWLAQNAPGAPWLAIDDEANLFAPDHPVLICNPQRGFDEQSANSLRRHLANLPDGQAAN